MKINKSLLSKIIKEEIKKALYESHKPWEQEIVQMMVQIYRDGNSGTLKDEQEYISQIEAKTKEPIEKTLQYFKNEDAVDHDLFRFVAGYLIKDKTSNLFSDYADFQLPSSYKDIHSRDMNDVKSPYDTRTPSAYIRKPQPIDQEKQDDIDRKKKKNLVHEEK